MLAQAFAVIAGDHDDGVVVDSGFFQEGDPVSDGGIGVGNFAVVEMVFVFLGERRRRFVGIVRIVEVNPDKVRSGGMFREPGFGVVDYVHAAALDASPVRFRFAVGIFIFVIRLGKVVIEIEAAIEAGS